MYIGNIDNQLNLGNNPYRDLYNGDEDNNTADDTDIKIVTAPVAITETIIDVDEEIKGVADRETTGVPDEHTGVATTDEEEITGVPDTESDDMASIDAAIAEVAAALDQKPRKSNE